MQATLTPDPLAKIVILARTRNAASLRARGINLELPVFVFGPFPTCRLELLYSATNDNFNHLSELVYTQLTCDFKFDVW